MNRYLTQNKICAIIPFYNESKTINEIIQNTIPYVDLLIAVNDGSTDDSIDKIPNDEKIVLISYNENRGKGYALNKGFAEGAKRNCSYTITLDADLQHLPEYIPTFISAMDNFDIVICNRLENMKNMPLQRILSNKLTSYLLGKKTKQKLFDTQCGFRSFKTEILKDILPKFNGFEAESEILVRAYRKNYKIGFVSIPTIYGNEKSKMKAIQAIWGFIKVMMV